MLALALSLLVCGQQTPAPAAPAYRAGVAAVEVTPELPIRLAGYASRSKEAATIDQRLFAKALAIAAGDEPPVVLVTLDSTGITTELRGRVLELLRQDTLGPNRVAPERLALTVTHSHTAPMLTGVIPNMFAMPVPADHQARIDAHTARVVDSLAKVVRLAIADLKPASLGLTRGQAEFARNRRTAGGPVDHDVPLLTVRGADGGLRAVVVGYACHCTTLGGDGNAVGGDWAGYAQEYLQTALPGCTALVTIGCGADSNPEPRGTLALAKQHGKTLADEVLRLLAGPASPITGPIAAHFDTVDLAFGRVPTRTDLLAAVSQGGAVGYHARVQLARLDRGEALRTSIALPVQSFTFGDELAMVFLGGEVVVDYALRLRREFDRHRLWTVAYANDVPAYIPSERILKEGGYEGGGAMLYYDQPSAFKQGLEQQLIDRVHTQVPAGFRPYGGLDAMRTEGVPPRSPQRSLASMQVRPGLRVELAACEPEVVDPVAIDFAPDGSLFVCEMRDYPTAGTVTGRIRQLRDRDGDGRYETATVFLDDVKLPTGILAWRDGVIVCTATEVIFAADRDGDGRAEVKEVLLSGFADHNEQALVNSPTLGLDGGIWFACGLFGGTITVPRTGATLDLHNRDFRFDPDRSALEAATGQTQQGRTRSDFGDWFGCDSSTLAWHYALPARETARNPFHAPRAARVYVPAGADPDRLFPISTALPRYNDFNLAGRTTSACGVAILRDDLLGDDLAGGLFVCEPAANIVHRLELAPLGATFRGTRAADESANEFLASTDAWFRPVQVRTGPDGALWVVDMYRFLIEHPRWVPEARLKLIDERAGDTMGRIYRVVPATGRTRPIPDLVHMDANAAPEQLVEQLASSNGTVRDLAQMRLQTMAASAAVPALQAFLKTATSGASRVQATSLLAIHGALQAADTMPLLADADANVRRHGVRLARPFLGDATVLRAVLACVDDSNGRVRVETAFALGDIAEPQAGAALAHLMLATDLEDTIAVDAVLASALPHLGALVRAALTTDAEPRAQLLALLLPAVAGQQDRELARLVTAAAFAPERPFAPAERLRVVRELVPLLSGDPLLAAAADDARRAAVDSAADVEVRAAAALLLGAAPARGDPEILLSLLRPDVPPPIQAAAVEALAAVEADVAARALEHWDAASPDLRNRLFTLLVQKPAGALAILQRAADTESFAASLSPARRQVLANHDDAQVRERAKAVLAAAAPRRGEVIARYRPASAIAGDVARGKAVFQRVCIVCHRLDGVGGLVGPDLAALTDRSDEALLESILDPNRAVRDDQAMYAVTLRDGRSFFGRIAGDDNHHLTVVTIDGEHHVLARSDIATQRHTGLSLMPEGLETQLTIPQMADLLSYLRLERRPRREFPGNLPAVIAPAADGSLQLLATNCEIYGDSLAFEAEFKNLGYWHGRGDQAIWTVDLPAATTFVVELDFACADAAAGNTFVVDGGAAPLRGTVAATGGWNHYVHARVGELELPAGRCRVTLHAYGELRSALMDLRGVHLVPR